MATINVASDRDPEVQYEVDMEAGTCTCPHFTNRLAKLIELDGVRRECKHIERVRRMQEEG